MKLPAPTKKDYSRLVAALEAKCEQLRIANEALEAASAEHTRIIGVQRNDADIVAQTNHRLATTEALYKDAMERLGTMQNRYARLRNALHAVVDLGDA